VLMSMSDRGPIPTAAYTGRMFFAGLALALTCAAWPITASAGELNFSAGAAAFVPVDWQDPASLPSRFRNHCTIDLNRGVAYCANHCGTDYAFYYCSAGSFGCCRLGRGYCDWDGHLRCAP
jgi:hypothetical protein